MKSDFARWLDYHGGAYPAFLEWIDKAENKPHVEHMRRLLGPYTYDQLVAATDALFRAESQPRGFGSHARAIRQHVAVDSHEEQKYGPRLIDDCLTAECSRCMDNGVIEVLSPGTLRILWRNPDRGENVLRTCMIACECNRGSRKARQLKLVQYQDNHALIPYEQVFEMVVSAGGSYDSVLDAEWHVARAMLLEHHDKYNKPQELTADALEW